MKNRIRQLPLLSLLLVVLSGCVTIAGKNLEPISPPPPERHGTVEYTIGDFAFTLDGGKMISSTKAGRILTDNILKRWKKSGYIDDYTYVKSGDFTGNADYQLTLSGSQYGESSIAMQILSGLTLLVLPNSTNVKYDIQYVLEDVASGSRYSAAVQDSYKEWTELLLIVALPVSARGANATMNVMADHAYDQLREKGAFSSRAALRDPDPRTMPSGS